MITSAPSITRFWPLAALLLLVLFPFGWVGEQSAGFGRLLGMMFPGVLGHAIGHSTMFCIVGFAFLLVFPKLRKRPLLYLGLIVAIAFGQELFQLAYKQRPIEFDEFRDLVTDLTGASAAFMLSIWLLHKLGDSEKHVK